MFQLRIYGLWFNYIMLCTEEASLHFYHCACQYRLGNQTPCGLGSVPMPLAGLGVHSTLENKLICNHEHGPSDFCHGRRSLLQASNCRSNSTSSVEEALGCKLFHPGLLVVRCNPTIQKYLRRQRQGSADSDRLITRIKGDSDENAPTHAGDKN